MVAIWKEIKIMIFGDLALWQKDLIFMMYYLILSKKLKPSLTKHKKMMLLFFSTFHWQLPIPLGCPKKRILTNLMQECMVHLFRWWMIKLGNCLPIWMHKVLRTKLWSFLPVTMAPIGNHTT